MSDPYDSARQHRDNRRAADPANPPSGLAAFAGALAGGWDSVDEDMAEILAARQDGLVDRPVGRETAG